MKNKNKIIPIESGVQWCRWTFNPWVGCFGVSEGCDYCYAERLMQGQYKKDFSNVKRTGKTVWKKPYVCNDLIHYATPVKDRLMFTASFSDIFIKEADGWRGDFWQLIRDNPRVIFQVLTKRIARAKKYLPDDWGDGYKNVWLGTSIENQKQADLRLKHLKDIPARCKFVSFEPLISYIDYSAPWLDWAIIGGESGNDKGEYKYRQCLPYWIQAIINQSKADGTAVFVKQLGTFLSKKMALSDRHGGNIDEFPAAFQLQEFPNFKL